MSYPKVAIVILNWNGWQDTIECLESIFVIDYPNFQVIVVDNGSTDASVEKIKQWETNRKKEVILLSLPANVGFARGNNHGIRYAGTTSDYKYILLLNNDTVVNADFLSQLVDCLESRCQAALSAPQVIDYYRGTFWQKPLPQRLNLLTYLLFATQLYRFFTRFIQLDSQNPSRIYVAPGCCLLLRSQVLRDIGGLDEHTFLGWEEYIIAERLFQKKWESYFVPKSVLRHKIGQSTDRMPSLKKTQLFMSSEAYYQKEVLKLNPFERVAIRMVRYLIYGILLLKGGK